jgi:hypothetical protein
LLKHEHDRNHYKTTRLAMDCMAKFYCNGLTVTLKSLSRQCITCQKKSAKPGIQIMGQLPDQRLGTLKQFSLVSMDACGHFTVKILNSSMKVWVLVLACLQTKAVHLEVIEGLKTEEVINALERMVARRGQIEEMHADNFASFIAAKAIITKEQQAQPEGGPETTKSRSRSRQPLQKSREEEVDLTKVQERLTAKVWKWTFSKPYSSEGNGVAEAMVKLTKEAMHTTFRHADIRINEFRTVVAKAEARVNSRPVATFRPHDCWENIQVLTPMHFSHGHLGGEVAPEADIEDLRNLPKRWALMQKHFSKYAKELNKGFQAQVLGSHKWAKMVKEIKVGTLVLVMSDNDKRYNWPLGLVTEVHRSKDGIVRAVAVRTKCMEGQRPTTVSQNVRELIPLTMFDNTDENPASNTDKDAEAVTTTKTIKEVTTEADITSTSVGKAKTDSQMPSTTVKATVHPRSGRHHHECPPPWAKAPNLQQSLTDKAIDTGVEAASSQNANTEATHQPQKVDFAENHGEHNNTEIKTRALIGAEEKEPNQAQKTPKEQTTYATGTGNEIRQNIAESPDKQSKEADKSCVETPKNAGRKTIESNDEERLQEETSTEDSKCIQKTPKTKYKTEVEKLIEMQSGLEVANSKRGNKKVLVEGQESNQCGHDEAKITGDGPQTGADE